MVIDTLSASKKEIIKWVKSSILQYGIKFSKRLSQVILVDPNVYRKIVEIVKQNIDINQNTQTAIIEIGAGLGTLTYALCSINTAYVIALEIDKKFVPILKKIQEYCYNADIVIGDAKKILNIFRGVNGVVGNLPYHITSDLIIAIGKTNALFSVITIQKDVAERLTARPGSKNYGKISLFARYLFDVHIVGIISHNSFIPSPDVLSAIILFKRKKSYNNYLAVEQLIKCMFSYRRKHVLKSLKKCLDIEQDKIIVLDIGSKLWRKRVYHLAPEDIDELVIVLKRLSLMQQQ